MDKDTRILFGATEGWGSFRRFPELTPLYGNNFDRHEISAGKEWNTYFGFIPWVPAYVARATPLVDLVYDYAGTGAAGMGSQRYALTARGGLSFRFGSMDDAEAIIRLRMGAGAAYNILNSGKGIVASGDFSLNVAGQASVSFVYCLSQYLCVGPKMAVGGDVSAGYSTFYGTLGFEVNGKVGPKGRLDVDSDEKPPVKPKPATPPVSSPVTPQVCPPPPPPADCEKVRAPLVQELAQCKKGHDTDKQIITVLQERIKTFEVRIPELIKTLQRVESVKYLTMVRPQGMVLFQNDSNELAMLTQTFPGTGIDWGKGNPTLDAVIRNVLQWMILIGDKHYTVEIEVRGFANETGGVEHNRALANARAKVVLDYLTMSQNTRDYDGRRVKPLSAGRILKSIAAVEYAANVDPKAEIRKILLAGRDAPKENSVQDKALTKDVQNPIWRMASIEYKITGPDGNKITFDEFAREFGLEGGKY